MRLFIAFFAFVCVACNDSKTVVPDEPVYYLVIPESDALWATQIEQGFNAGCEQLQMPCEVVKHEAKGPDELAKLVGELPDSRRAPYAIVFAQAGTVSKTLDLLSLEQKQAITVGLDNSNAYRLGHVGVDAKRLAWLVAMRAAQQTPERRRILYVLGNAPVDAVSLEASAYRESDDWSKYRLRFRPLAEVTEEDYRWSDLVVPLGEDALAAAIESDVSMIFPTDPSDEGLALLGTERTPIVLALNYFDVGFRTTRIAREQFLNGRISNPIIQSQPTQVDKESLQFYLEDRFKIPEIKPSPPARKGPN